MTNQFTKCEFCDYCEAQGSGYGSSAPGENGKVKERKNGKFLCDVCWLGHPLPKKPILTDEIYEDEIDEEDYNPRPLHEV